MVWRGIERRRGVRVRRRSHDSFEVDGCWYDAQVFRKRMTVWTRCEVGCRADDRHPLKSLDRKGHFRPNTRTKYFLLTCRDVEMRS
jgi:hypothetical protein